MSATQNDVECATLEREVEKCQTVNRRLLGIITDLEIENAALRKRLQLYEKYSTDVTHELVMRALRGDLEVTHG